METKSNVELDAVGVESQHGLTADASKQPIFNKYLHQYFNDVDPSKTCAIYDSGIDVYKLTYGEVDKYATCIKSHLYNVTDLRGFIGVLHGINEFFPSIQLGILRTGCGFLNLEPDRFITTVERAYCVLNMKFLLVSRDLYNYHQGWFKQNSKNKTMINLRDDAYQKGGQDLHCVELKDGFTSEIGMKYNDVLLSPFRFAYAMETSGTTGKKKFVLVPHQSICPNIQDFIDRVWKTNPSDVFWGSSPCTFDPSVCDLFVSMGSGGTILYTRISLKYDGRGLGNLMLKHRVSVVQTTPSIVRRIWTGLISTKFLDHDLSSLKVLAFGGEKCLNKEELRSLLSQEMYTSLRALVNLYGLTEMSCWASFSKINPYNDDPIYLGEPLYETSISTETYNDDKLPGFFQIKISTPTRICTIISDDGVVVQEDPKFTSRRDNIIDGKLVISTGDMSIQYNPSHAGIQYIGRVDTVVKRSGMKIPLCVIEEIAKETGYVKYAQGIEHDNKIYLIVIPKHDETTIIGLGKEVRASFIPNLELDIHPEFYPNWIIAVHTVPVTSNGKLDIHEILKASNHQQYKYPGKYRINKTTVQHLLHPLWLIATEINAPLETIKGHNFYESGGTSFKAVWLLESFFTCVGVYGSPLLSELLEELTKKLALTTFDGVCDSLTIEVEKRPMMAQVAVISAEIITTHKMHTESDLHGRTPIKSTNIHNRNHKKDISDANLKLEDSAIEEALQKDIIINHPIEVLKVFEYDLNMCVDANAVLCDKGFCEDVVIIGSHAGSVIAVDTQELRRLMLKENHSEIEHQAAVLWTQCVPDRIEADVVINSEGSFVYLCCYNGTVLKLSTIDGSVICSYKCKGSIQRKVVLSDDDSKLVIVDNNCQMYCLDQNNLQLMWRSQIRIPMSSRHTPVIEGNFIILTATGGVEGHSIGDGCRMWSTCDERNNKACTSPLIWNSPKGKVVIYGTRDGYEIRNPTNGKLVTRGELKETELAWFDPIVHNCKHKDFSEVILTSACGIVLRLAIIDGALDVQRMRVDNPLVSPSVICTQSRHDNEQLLRTGMRNTLLAQRKCYLLSKPGDSENFVLYGLTTPSKENVLQRFSSNQKCFSRPAAYKDMIAFGGRDNQLHILFCMPGKKDKK